MRAKITNIGPNYGIVLGKPILDALNIAPETEVEIRVEKGTLVVRPIRGTQHNAVAEEFQPLVDNPEELIAVSSQWFG